MYRERTSRVSGAVVWHGTAPERGRTQRVLPDGCMDLLWLDGRLVVAGPDTVAHHAAWVPGAGYTGLRFAPGHAPAVLGVPAHALRDQRVPLDAIWPDARVRRLVEEVAGSADPGAALEAIAAGRRYHTGPSDPAVPAIVRSQRAGLSVAATAAELGLSERQLRRRCRTAFGYGPKTLARILRMRRALAEARAGVAFADAATAAGYADQAHLAREVRALAGVPLGALMP